MGSIEGANDRNLEQEQPEPQAPLQYEEPGVAEDHPDELSTDRQNPANGEDGASTESLVSLGGAAIEHEEDPARDDDPDRYEVENLRPEPESDPQPQQPAVVSQPDVSEPPAPVSTADPEVIQPRLSPPGKEFPPYLRLLPNIRDVEDAPAPETPASERRPEEGSEPAAEEVQEPTPAAPPLTEAPNEAVSQEAVAALEAPLERQLEFGEAATRLEPVTPAPEEGRVHFDEGLYPVGGGAPPTRLEGALQTPEGIVPLNEEFMGTEVGTIIALGDFVDRAVAVNGATRLDLETSPNHVRALVDRLRLVAGEDSISVHIGSSTPPEGISQGEWDRQNRVDPYEDLSGSLSYPAFRDGLRVVVDLTNEGVTDRVRRRLQRNGG